MFKQSKGSGALFFGGPRGICSVAIINAGSGSTETNDEIAQHPEKQMTVMLVNHAKTGSSLAGSLETKLSLA
jgi:hypothetical protein